MAEQDEDFTHGASGYANHRCHCGVCRAGHAEESREFRRRYAERRRQAQAAGLIHVVEHITHGEAGYNTYSCRCEVCRRSKSDAMRRARQQP